MCTPCMRVGASGQVRKIKDGVRVLHVRRCARVCSMLTVDCWTLWGAACLCLKASTWSKEAMWKNQRDRGSDRRLSAPSSHMTGCLPAQRSVGGVGWSGGPQSERPLRWQRWGAGSRWGGEGGETRTGRWLFPLVLNIASACLAGFIKNTENSTERGTGGGTCRMYACVCVCLRDCVWICTNKITTSSASELVKGFLRPATSRDSVKLIRAEWKKVNLFMVETESSKKNF